MLFAAAATKGGASPIVFILGVIAVLIIGFFVYRRRGR